MRELTLTLSSFIIDQKQRIIFFIKVVIGLLLIIYLYNSISIDKILKALNNVNSFLLCSSIILVIPNIFLQFYKWKIVCNNSLSEYNSSKIFNSLFTGFSAGIITPMRLGEIAGRMLIINDKNPLKVTAATLLDKLFTFVQIIWIGVISISLYLYFQVKFSFIIALLEVTIFILLTIVVSVFIKRYAVNKEAPLRNIKYLSKLLSFLDEIFSYKKGAILKLFLASFLFYLCYLVQFALLIYAFTNQQVLYQYIWMGSLVMLVNAVFPVSFSGLGIRESASVFFLYQIGVEPSSSFNASIFLFMINILFPSMLGLFILFRRR